MLGWVTQVGIKIAGRNINHIRYADDTSLIAENKKKQEFLDEGERGEWKSWLKTQLQKTKIMASSPITSWQIDGEKVKTVTDFIFLGSRISWAPMVTAAMKVKDACSLGGKLWQT